jgi:hypothetical protein
MAGSDRGTRRSARAFDAPSAATSPLMFDLMTRLGESFPLSRRADRRESNPERFVALRLELGLFDLAPRYRRLQIG